MHLARGGNRETELSLRRARELESRFVNFTGFNREFQVPASDATRRTIVRSLSDRQAIVKVEQCQLHFKSYLIIIQKQKSICLLLYTIFK